MPARPRRSALRAFTLIELLVVIGIIAVLIGVLVTVLGRVRRQSNQLVCMNNLRQMGAGTLLYIDANRGYLPYEGFAEGDRQVRHLGWFNDPAVWFNAIPKALGLPSYAEMQKLDADGTKPLPKDGSTNLFVCPEAGPAVAGPQDDVVTDGYFMLWGTEDEARTIFARRKTYWCYGYNTQLDNAVEERNVAYRVTTTVLRIPHPAVTAFIVEKLMSPQEFSPPFASGVGQQEVSYKEFTTRHQMGRATKTSAIADYKYQGGHILFVDGHVQFFSRGEVLYPPGAPFNYDQPGKLMWTPR